MTITPLVFPSAFETINQHAGAYADKIAAGDVPAAKTATAIEAAGDGVVRCDATTGAIVYTLLTAAGRPGAKLYVKKIDASANTVTIDPAGAETIDGAATLVLSARWDAVLLVSDGVNWLRGYADGLLAAHLNDTSAAHAASTISFAGSTNLAATDVEAALDELDAEKASALVVANLQTASYTLVLTDAGKVVEMNVAAANTLTVPPNSSVAFPIGATIEVYQQGAGQTTITAGTGVTIRERESKLKLAGQYATASLRKRATDEWVLAGDVAA